MKADRRLARFSSIAGDQRGATAVEYGLIMALVCLAAMGGVAALGDSVQGRWDNIAERVSAI